MGIMIRFNQVRSIGQFWRRSGGFFALLVLVSLALTLAQPALAQAQDTGSADWTTPVNLSRSGSASEPVLLPGSPGNLFAFWLDPFSGYQYAHSDGKKWSAAQPAMLPIDITTDPKKTRFFSDGARRIYTLWLDTSFSINYSFTDVQPSQEVGGWAKISPLSTSTVTYAAALDSNRNIHLVYLVGQDTGYRQAGIYYALVDSVGNVLFRQPLDVSAYYRSLSPTARGGLEQVKAKVSNVAVTVIPNGDRPIVLASWNNLQTQRMFLRRSLDGGRTWENAQELATPAETASTLAPREPQFYMIGKTILLFWKYSQDSGSCTQYFQESTDNGATWGERKGLFADMGQCPTRSQLLKGPNDQAVLFAVLNSGPYFSVWNGQDFDAPQIQNTLVTFQNPETFNPVQLGCQQAAWVADQFFAAGCSTGSGPDVWVTSRATNGILNPGSVLAAWSAPQVVAYQTAPLQSLSLLADPVSGLTHAFWSQPEDAFAGGPGVSLFYAGWQKPSVQQAAAILNPPGGKNNQPSVVTDANGRMYIVWSGGKSGDIMLSWAATNRTSNALDWFKPIALPVPRAAAAQPKIQVTSDGTLYVAYLVPFNEARGVYLTRSTDRGETWSQPARVFDAAAADCDMVDQVSLAVSSANTLHAGWICSTIPGGTGPLAFRYARSADGGATWSVQPNDTPRAVVWGEVANSLPGSLHRVWQELANGRFIFFDQVSKDDGLTWSAPDEVAATDLQPGPAGLSGDPAGQLYLYQVIQDDVNLVLKYWKWDGASWTPGESRSLGGGQISQVDSVAGAVLPQGALAVVYGYRDPSPRAGFGAYELTYLSHPVEVKAAAPVAIRTVRPTATVVATPQATAVQASAFNPTPTIDFRTIQQDTTAKPASIMTYAIGAGLTLLMISAVVFWQFRSRMR